MSKIALIGPGAIGGVLSSFLIENKANSVGICARTPFKTLKVTFEGRTKEYEVSVHVSPETVQAVDWILLATKTYQVSKAAEWLPHLTGPNTRLAVIQNGVEHIANVATFLPVERTIPVIIDCPVERKASGQLIRHGDIRMDIPLSEASREFAQLFNHPAITVHQTPDWTTAAWRKLCINAAGAVSALVNKPANIAGNSTAAALMEALIAECIEVGRAEGAVLSEDLIQGIISNSARAPEGSMNSLHADLVAGRPMEWDARNGVIARLGEKHGIPTPYNKLASQLLSLLECST